jgi:spore coat polysaccharide biosynthesis protein SpsF
VKENNKIVAIILSRFSSSRLPGKALLPIKGKVVLKYIVERLKACNELDEIVIATSNQESDDEIQKFSDLEGIKCYRGSLTNVANRFLEASKAVDCKYAIRINGDNIFLDIELLAKMIKIARLDTYNFISNVPERTFPRGMSIEIVKVAHYEEMQSIIQSREDFKEHVTLGLYENFKPYYKYIKNDYLPEAKNIQLALDSNEDLIRTEYIISQFTEDHTKYGMESILKILSKYHE